MAQISSCISNITSLSVDNSEFNMTINPGKDPDDKLRKIANWFTSINFRNIQDDTFTKHTPETGIWFLNNSEFQAWLSKYTGFLWIKGPPGAGKTILSSIVIDYLQKRLSSVQKSTILFAYFRYTDGYSITDILASFVKQLAQDHSSIIFPIIEPIYDNHQRKETRPNKHELQELLKKLLDSFEKAYIIVDALDEVPDDARPDLLEVLLSLPANLLLTSRPLATLEQCHSNAAYVHLEDENWKDIKLFLEKEIDKSPSLTTMLKGKETVRKEICAKLKQKSRGMFLLASLQIDSLRHCTSIKKLRTTVESLPSRLDDLYERTWERIKAQTEDEVSLATRAIIWLTYAYQPLSVTELQHAVAVSDEGESFDEDDITSEELIVSVCCGLIVVDQQSGIVRLVHYTAHNFFTKYRSGLFARPHAFIAISCVLYLSAFDFLQQKPSNLHELNKFLVSQPLLRYAYRSWGFHLKACYCEGRLPAVVSDFVAQVDIYPFIISDCGFDILKPCHIAACYGLPDLLPVTVNEWCIQVTDIFQLTPLILASANGHRAVVEELLCRNDVDINSQDKRGHTALFAASYKGHEAIVKLLLSRTEVAVNTIATIKSEAPGQTALLMASRNGYEGIVKLLLSRNDIDINLQDKDGQTALFASSHNGHETIAKLLLSRPDVAINHIATIKSPYPAGQTALLTASRNGHEGIVKLLLSRSDIDINSQDKDGQTALFAASCRGHEPIVKLLCSRTDIAINTTTTFNSLYCTESPGQTALLAASRNGHEGIVKLLLSQNDIDVNSQDKRGQTALFAASHMGHEAIVRLLLSRTDVAVNTATTFTSLYSTESPGQTALLTASRNGYEGIVKLLLSRNDIDINSQDRHGHTALFAASHKNHEAIVKLLLSRPDVAINTSTTFNSPYSTNETAGHTALLTASRNGYEGIVKVLLSRHDIDINSQDEDGQTALFAASRKGHEAIVKLLLSRTYVAINAITTKSTKRLFTRIEPAGQTALLAASRNGHEGIVKQLLSRNNVDIDAQDENGQTALMAASRNGYKAIARLLRSRNVL